MKNHLRNSNHIKNKPYQGNLFELPNTQEDSSNSMLKHFIRWPFTNAVIGKKSQENYRVRKLLNLDHYCWL